MESGGPKLHEEFSMELPCLVSLQDICNLPPRKKYVTNMLDKKVGFVVVVVVAAAVGNKDYALNKHKA